MLYIYLKVAAVCSEYPLLRMYSLHLPILSPANIQWIRGLWARILSWVTDETDLHLCSLLLLHSCDIFNLILIWSSQEGKQTFRRIYERTNN